MLLLDGAKENIFGTSKKKKNKKENDDDIENSNDMK